MLGGYREDPELYNLIKKRGTHEPNVIPKTNPTVPAEEEIARLASEGFQQANRRKSVISENTVKKHLKGVFEKLGLEQGA
jgi:DNA-binding NarL/FixJ family response regulator